MSTSLRTSLSLAIVLLMLRAYHADVCCFPSQFECHANHFMPNEKAKIYRPYIERDFDISFDWTKKRLRQYSPATGYVELLFFEKAVVYFIRNSTCSIKLLEPPKIGAFCVPDNAKRMKSYTLGVKEQINVTDYLYKIDQTQMLRTISDNCVPVFDLIFHAKSNFKNFNTILATYQNLTLGIKDEKVFDVPSFCKSSAKKEINSKVEGTSLFWNVFV
ncbi:uncharacterized protein LOC132748082 [Ruditapes philippinarum]|uniref:uncharacterized protein LOC132748082 n=1 Tax=Ruditapes philippinarum TaxID=129788 RepID=UPI00295A9A67|nr:uncharacterized protein LOC132748082 [Ruditapes philippinarum]XP_060593611.1 uncharacterized protein LOC132748082 [Ruditapes philippinarum]